MSRVGCYRGYHWMLKPICDVLAVSSKARWYFILDGKGQFTGDHFRTLHELRWWIDERMKRYCRCRYHGKWYRGIYLGESRPSDFAQLIEITEGPHDGLQTWVLKGAHLPEMAEK